MWKSQVPNGASETFSKNLKFENWSRQSSSEGFGSFIYLQTVVFKFMVHGPKTTNKEEGSRDELTEAQPGAWPTWATAW